MEEMINELGDKIEKRFRDKIKKMINELDDKTNNRFNELEKKIDGISTEISQVKIKVTRLDTEISHIYSSSDIGIFDSK